MPEEGDPKAKQQKVNHSKAKQQKANQGKPRQTKAKQSKKRQIKAKQSSKRQLPTNKCQKIKFASFAFFLQLSFAFATIQSKKIQKRQATSNLTSKIKIVSNRGTPVRGVWLSGKIGINKSASSSSSEDSRSSFDGGLVWKVGMTFERELSSLL